MAGATDEGECFKFIWQIENFCIFHRFKDDILTSAVFKTEDSYGNEGQWYLCIYAIYSNFHFQLHQLDKSCYPDKFECIISFCGDNLCTKDSMDFTIRKADLFGKNMKLTKGQNTLTLHCKMWKHCLKKGQLKIKSMLRRVEFSWFIEENIFSSPDSTTYFRKKIIQNENFRINMTLDCTDSEDCTICALALPTEDDCFSFINCNFLSYDLVFATPVGTRAVYNYSRTQCRQSFTIAETNRGINASSELYIHLDCIVSHHNECQYEEQNPTSSQAKSVPETFCCLMRQDLLKLYRESILSDVTINADGKTFSAHRSILAARSPVFRAMFEKDEMSEGRSGVVDIDDVDSETVDRMLVFLYGGFLEDLKLEDTSDLYYAADKYAVLPLKQKCADMQKGAMSLDSVCEALVLADMHSDDQLKKCAVDFIYDHEEVFLSSKWEELEINNPRLTSRISKELFLKKRRE